MEAELRGSARLGNYLRRLRVGYGLSLRRVEDKAKSEGGEIDNSQLSRYERGRCYPSFDKLCLLASIFNVPIQNFSDLLDLERVEEWQPGPGASYEEMKARANQAYEQGNYTQAYAIYERSLAHLEEGREGAVDADTMARARYNLARSLLRLGKISLAETELRLILRKYREVSPATMALVLLCLAATHDEKGDRYLALLEAEKCLTISREIASPEYEGYAQHCLARSHFLQGDYQKAMECFRQARELLEGRADRHDLTLMRVNIGFCHAMVGKIDRGIRELKEALAASTREGFRRCSAYALLYLGQVHQMKAEDKKARDFYEEAELMAHGGEERYVDILFKTAYHLWEMARSSGNAMQEKVYFGRLKFLRSQLDRQFVEVEAFDQFIEQGKGR